MLPKLEQIMELRDYSEKTGEYAFFYFADKFLDGVAGRKAYKKNKTWALISDTVTISDEAFALLVLENNWDKWQKQYQANRAVPMNGKYTTTWGGAKKFEGWPLQATKCYNELYIRVKKDRRNETALEVEQQFLQDQQENESRNPKKSK